MEFKIIVTTSLDRLHWGCREGVRHNYEQTNKLRGCDILASLIKIAPISIVLYTSNLIYIVLLKLSFGLGCDNLDNQTKILCLHYTVYSTHYTVYYTDHSLVHQKQ